MNASTLRHPTVMRTAWQTSRSIALLSRLCDSSYCQERAPRRMMTDRASGPGGLFKSSESTINPWDKERRATRLRLHRARVDLENHHRTTTESCENEGNSNEKKYEDEMDIVNFVELQIEETMKRGGFDNLRGKGRPLPRGRPRTTLEFAMRIMRENGLRPPWLQLMHDIDHETKSLRTMLVNARRKHMPHRWRHWHAACKVAHVRIMDVNEKIDVFNLQRPFSVRHVFRLRLRITDEMRRAVKEARKLDMLEQKQQQQQQQQQQPNENGDVIRVNSNSNSSNRQDGKDGERRQQKGWRGLLGKVFSH